MGRPRSGRGGGAPNAGGGLLHGSNYSGSEGYNYIGGGKGYSNGLSSLLAQRSGNNLRDMSFWRDWSDPPNYCSGRRW
eukprot:3419826-Pyramimonas_sp.AAC.1